jgi:hypothetical protein
MSLRAFLQTYGAQRVQQYASQPELWNSDPDEELKTVLDYECPSDKWMAITPAVPAGWSPMTWEDRPRRFVDGKDDGETVIALRAPGGYPIAVRLSQIGSTVLEVVDGICYRRFAVVELVVSMVVKPFPWHEIESFAIALQEQGIRLLPAQRPKKGLPYDFEVMRKAAQNRSNDEMATLEEYAVSQDNAVPTVVDGRLEPRSGGFHQERSPIIGVIKQHHQNYLHPLGMQLMYQPQPGQRTPVFAIPGTLDVVSWYLRFTGGMPNYGLVRVELPQKWFEQVKGQDFGYVDQLSRLLYDYRCRDQSYGRAALSLHPTVRAEQSLGALFQPLPMLMSRFYRMAAL